ncbi:MAG: hypothetical protein IJG16_05485 [Clostridia bacterium]|nr:hypothetical protein [Clostridia bacterium]
MPDKIYKCAECGRVITDKEYLSAVKGNKLKFCSTNCDKAAWRRIRMAAEIWNFLGSIRPPATRRKEF